MTEQHKSNSTYSSKDSITYQTHLRNSPIHYSLSNKLDSRAVTPVPVMTITSLSSTTSLEMYSVKKRCIDSSIRRHPTKANEVKPTTVTATGEDHVFNDDVEQQTSLSDVDKNASLSDNDDDSDSFDDDDELILPESLYSTVSSALTNHDPKSCPICFEVVSLQSVSCCTFSCCESCWHAHISATLNNGRIKILCASNDCNKYLPRETVLNLIRHNSSLHERYLKLHAKMNQDSRAKTCPRCSHLYSLDAITPVGSRKIKKIPKQVQCSECSLVWCFRCAAPWHENLTCKQFIKGDKLLMKWINQKTENQWNARKCPKCSSFIQRAGGCPHMTCSSCSCEFCYTCGRRYVKIPIIGEHSNKFSVFGCPYKLYPDHPWRRRAIRGTIATGAISVSPAVAAVAAVAAVVVLPPFAIYKLVRRVRARRIGRVATQRINIDMLVNEDHLEEDEYFDFDLPEEYDEHVPHFIREYIEESPATQTNNENINDAFPLSIFANMDIDNLFSEDNNSQLGFSTRPRTSTMSERKKLADRI